MTTTSELDQAKAEAFAERVMTILNDGALAVMISIGHRTGLFDTLANLPPATSAQIAQAAGLNERYVREWLAALVTGGIVDYDPQTHTYQLPAEHAAWLTRAASPNNLAVTCQFIPHLGAMHEPILEVFRSGGGLHYHQYPRFHEIMAEDSAQTVVAALFDAILPLVPELEGRLERGVEVLDLGCGRGLALLALAEAFPRSRFTGYDLGADAIAFAQAQARQRALTNMRFAALDAAQLDESSRYDLICTFDAIHDQGDPARVLANIRRAVSRRCLPDAGHSRLQRAAQQPGSPSGAAALHRLDHPLHQRLAGAGRRGPGHDVG
jgi:hypothetical protein